MLFTWHLLQATTRKLRKNLGHALEGLFSSNSKQLECPKATQIEPCHAVSIIEKTESKPWTQVPRELQGESTVYSKNNRRHKSEGTEAWVSDNAKHLSVEILNALNWCCALRTVTLIIRYDSVISMSTLQRNGGISMHQHKKYQPPAPMCFQCL